MQRVKSVDIFKSIGIICMIWGHTSMCPESWARYFTCFYMPMFFCISGYFYHETTIQNMIKKKAISLLMPYFLTGFLGIFLCHLFFDPEYSMSDTFDSLFWHPYNLPSLVGALWFLMALFWAEVIFTLLKKTQSELVLGIGCVILALVGCFMRHFTEARPIWSLDSAMTSIGFIYIGYMAHRFRNSKIVHVAFNLPCYAIVLLLIINIHLASYNHVTMWLNSYQNVPLFLFNAVLGSTIWYNISKYINGFKFTEGKWLADIMSYIGNNSIVFLCFNQLVIATYKRILISTFGGWPQDISQKRVWFVILSVFTLLTLICIAQLNIRRKQLLNYTKKQNSEKKTKRKVINKSATNSKMLVQKHNKSLNNIAFIVFNILFAWILVLLLFIDRKVNCVTLSNITILSFGIVILWGIYVLYKRLLRKYLYKLSDKQFQILIYILFVFLFILQCLITYAIYFLTRWDVEVLRNASNFFAAGNKMGDSNPFQNYFLTYYNNVFLTTVFTIIKKIFNHISFLAGNRMIVLISIICINFSGMLTIKSVDYLLKKRGLTIFAFAVFSLLMGISPWMIIPYSDTYSILFTTLTFYLYITKKSSKHLWLCWLMLCVCAGIGYLIKPTTMIIFVAICIVEIWSWLFANRKEKIKQLRVIPAVLFAFLIVVGVNKASYTYIGFEKNEDYSQPLTHYVMMGLNPITNGAYYSDDVVYTSGFQTHSEKVAGNIAMIKKRLKEYGAIGYFTFLCRKALANYNDGTFSWGIGGDFFGYASLNEGNTLQIKLKSLFYNDGENYGKLACMQHGIWIMILFMIIFVNKKCGGGEAYSNNIIVAIMAIIGITLFTLIFESRARYLFLYTPLYIVLGILGVDALINKTSWIFHLNKFAVKGDTNESSNSSRRIRNQNQ